MDFKPAFSLAFITSWIALSWMDLNSSCVAYLYVKLLKPLVIIFGLGGCHVIDTEGGLVRSAILFSR